MFERFTDRARRVVILAQEEARGLDHNYIGTEHILLGLIREKEGIAAQVLFSLNISPDAVRSEVIEIVGYGQTPTAIQGPVPFTPRAKKVFELALRESIELGRNRTGAEHILLGLIREKEGVAAQVLQSLGVSLHLVRQQVLTATPSEDYTDDLPQSIPIELADGDDLPMHFVDHPLRDDARWRIAGGILGLVGAGAYLAATLHFSLPGTSEGVWNWLGTGAWPLVAALSAVCLLAAGRRWSLLGAGGLLATSLIGILDAVSTMMLQRQLFARIPPGGIDFTGLFDRARTAQLVACLISLVGGVVAIAGRGRDPEDVEIINVIR